MATSVKKELFKVEYAGTPTAGTFSKSIDKVTVDGKKIILSYAKDVFADANDAATVKVTINNNAEVAGDSVKYNLTSTTGKVFDSADVLTINNAAESTSVNNDPTAVKTGVIDKITALTTASDKTAILEARDAYDALSLDKRAYVTNYDVLREREVYFIQHTDTLADAKEVWEKMDSADKTSENKKYITTLEVAADAASVVSGLGSTWVNDAELVTLSAPSDAITLTTGNKLTNGSVLTSTVTGASTKPFFKVTLTANTDCKIEYNTAGVFGTTKEESVVFTIAKDGVTKTVVVSTKDGSSKLSVVTK